MNVAGIVPWWNRGESMEVDSWERGLLFERFMNLERSEEQDIRAFL
jgi:hypothetical protein